eukprot:762288_1
MALCIKQIMLYLVIFTLLINPARLKHLTCVGNNHANGNCIMDCGANNCANKLVEGKYYTSLSIICIDNPKNFKCDNLKVFCPINGECNLNCQLENGCTNMHILSEGNMSQLKIDCGQYSCSNITINGSNINVLEINAIGPNSFLENHIFAESVDIFTLNCGDYNIHSRAACFENQLYLPSHNKVSINCFGEACRGDSIHILEGMDAININILSNCECEHEINNCANYWYLFCDSYYKSDIAV